VEHDGHGVGVVPEVGQLVVGVAVVRVDRDQPRLPRRVERLQVLRPVVEVLRHLVLALDAELEEGGGDPVGPPVELLPREAPVPVDLRRRVGLDVGHRLPHLGDVPSRHDHPL
jgi:hypothetical protein